MKNIPVKGNGKGWQHIGQLIRDDRNARKHNEKNIGMIGDALQEVGAARSIVIDEKGVVLAGNGVLEAAGAVGITKLQVVDADGETIVAVRRSGLTAKQKKRLALFDNRTTETSVWDDPVLAEMLKEDETILKGIFGASTIARLSEDNPLEYHEKYELVIECKDSEQQETLFNRMTGEGYKCRVLNL